MVDLEHNYCVTWDLCYPLSGVDGFVGRCLRLYARVPAVFFFTEFSNKSLFLSHFGVAVYFRCSMLGKFVWSWAYLFCMLLVFFLLWVYSPT